MTRRKLESQGQLKPHKQLKKVIEDLGGRLIIFIAQIDPDAIASAIGLKKIVRYIKPEQQVEIVYFGPVGHPQNRAIINKCNIAGILTPGKEYKKQTNDKIALVDSSSLKDARLSQEISRNDVAIIIDHHQYSLEPPTENQFFLIDETGACATLIVELAKKLEVQFNENDKLLITMAIHTDTKALVAASKRDRDAYGVVTDEVDPIGLTQLINHSLPPSHFDNAARALSNMKKKDGRLVAGIGQVEGGSADDLSTIADYLLRMQDVTLVVIWGIINGQVRISARNSDLSTSLDEFLHQRFGTDSGAKLAPDGRGEGGAAVKLDIGPWICEKTTEEVEALVDKRMKVWILDEF